MESSNTVAVVSNAARDRTVTELIVETVAELKCVGMTDLTPMYDVIDPDALDKFYETELRRSAQAPSVEFAYEDCNVIVDTDGEVTVRTLQTDESCD